MAIKAMNSVAFAALLERITGDSCSRPRAHSALKGKSICSKALVELVNGNEMVRAAIDAAYPEGREVPAYMTLYATIYDGDPDESGPCAWPEFTDVAYRGRTTKNIRRRVVADAVHEARDCGQYEEDDVLWFRLVDADGTIVETGEF